MFFARSSMFVDSRLSAKGRVHRRMKELDCIPSLAIRVAVERGEMQLGTKRREPSRDFHGLKQ
jgi:hypothetical protein